MFRGEQYARAIGLFQRKNGPGTLPPSFDMLVEQRFLRKKFKDPITDDEFVPVALAAGSATAGQITPPAGSPPAGSPPGAAPPEDRRAAPVRRRRRGRARWHAGGGDRRWDRGCNQQKQGKLHSSLQGAEPLQRVDVRLHAAGASRGRGRSAGNGGPGSRWTRPSWRSGRPAQALPVVPAVPGSGGRRPGLSSRPWRPRRAGQSVPAAASGASQSPGRQRYVGRRAGLEHGLHEPVKTLVAMQPSGS